MPSGYFTSVDEYPIMFSFVIMAFNSFNDTATGALPMALANFTL